MPGISIAFSAESLRNFGATLRQITDTGTLGDVWNQAGGAWEAAPSFANAKITLTEGTTHFLGLYSGGRAAAGTYTGWILKNIHDTDDSNKVVASQYSYLVNGAETRTLDSSDITNLEADVADTLTQATTAATEATTAATQATTAATQATTAATQATTAATEATSANTQATSANTQATAAAADAALAKNAAQLVEIRLTSSRAGNLEHLDTNISDVLTQATTAATQATTAATQATTAATQATTAATEAATAATQATTAATQATTAATQAGTAATQATAAATSSASVDTKLSTGRANNLDNLSGGPVALEATVSGFADAPRAELMGPTLIPIPSSGSTSVKFQLFIKDAAGNMEVPDSAPTFTAANEAGTDRSANLGAVSNPGNGRYEVTYSVAAAHLAEQITVTGNVTDNGITFRQVHTFTVEAGIAAGGGFLTTDRTKLDEVHAKLPSKPFLTGTNAADGDVDLDAADGDRNTFKADITGLATAADLALVATDVDTAVTQATTAATQATTAATQATTAATQATTAATQATTAATEATTAATEATSANTQATAAAADAATIKPLAITLEGRLTGPRATNLDNLDVPVSTRSDFDPTTDPVDLDAGHGLATAAEQALIKAKTDLIPAAPASVSDIPTAAEVAAEVDTVLAVSQPGDWSSSGDATFAMQQSILTAVGAIVPSPPSGVINVIAQRTWRLRSEGEDTLSPNIVILPVGFNGTVAMDFGEILNPGTAISTVALVDDLSVHNLAATDLAVSPDRRKAHFNVTGLVAGRRYEMKVDITTSDGQTLTGRGKLWAE